jgi:rhodanese-related sulfurtransferase
MKVGNFLRVLLLTAALSSYSAWSLAERQSRRSGGSIAPESYVADIPLLRRADVETLWHQPSTLFLDVRSLTDYEFGHIQGAVSLPEEEFEERLPALRPRLEQAKTLIVYCKSVDCGKSLWTAMRLRQAGLRHAMIYPAGWNEWFTHKLPIDRNREQ